MDPDAELKADRPREALRLLQTQVKGQPDSIQLRSRLFQVLCIVGEWERAETQLQLLPELEKVGSELMLAAPPPAAAAPRTPG